LISLRKAQDRGHANYGWLDTWHTFSFGDYYDPAHMGFSVLRVINDDRVAPGAGFPTHGHRDMEILSYVIEGALEHADSMGNSSVIRAGEVQRMSAGTGVTHSECNASKTEPVHFLQIWLLPEEQGLEPGYEQRRFDIQDKRNTLQLIASPDGREESLTIHQAVSVFAGYLTSADRIVHRLAANTRAYVHVAGGALSLNGQSLNAGDGARIGDEAKIELGSDSQGELLLFELSDSVGG